MNKPKRVAVIGVDCALPHLMERYIAEGHLPNFKRLFEGGTYAENCLVPYPTITPPNWASIATGANIGTHGVTDFWLPIPGKTPDTANTAQAFSSEHVKAEYIWDAADKAGKKCIVLNYPGSWPSQMKNGIVVGGAAISPVNNMDGLRQGARTSLCGNQLITTGYYPRAIRGQFESAQDWANLSEPGEDPLEMTADLIFPSSDEEPAPTTWYVLARQSGDEGYDRVTLSPTKDLDDAFCTLAVNQWSPKIFTKIKMASGVEREVFFRCKLIELSENAEDFRLFLTTFADVSRVCSPPDVAVKLTSADGVPVPSCGMPEAMLGLIDWDTYGDCAIMHSQWLADAAVSLLTAADWQVFFMHSHPVDYSYHLFLSAMDPLVEPDEAKRAKAWDLHLRVYEAQDRMVGQIVNALPKDTLVVLISDHGAVADGVMFDPYKALAQAGLATVTKHMEASSAWEEHLLAVGQLPVSVDLSRTRALPQGSCYVNVHLKGRDPEGVVAPEDYEKVQHEIIDALYTYIDPVTGKRPVALALTKDDSRLLGLYGDKVGDVVYALYPWFGGQHGMILPTARWGIGSLRGLFVLNGPGINQGCRLQRTVHLTDLVPTICHLLDLPLPKHAEGAVIYQAFKDPDFKRHETGKLMDGLRRMEAALARQTREPWDKHDCA